MTKALPKLRTGLDLLPSPREDQPGLFIRDPYRYSDAMVIIPPQLVHCLLCFDGEQTELDLHNTLAHLTGQVAVSDLVRHVTETLDRAGFLDNDTYAEMRAQRRRQFAEAAVREPAHAGHSYPADAGALRTTLDGYLAGAAPAVGHPGRLIGIAAPHASPEGGAASYRAAYRSLSPEMHDRTFVILGTSHYGEPDHFGLTRKPFVTPLGHARTDRRLFDLLAKQAAGAVDIEDYCHAVEHSIEFQVLFLQHLYGPEVKVLPVLCGPFVRGARQGTRPEDAPAVERFISTLGELAAREADNLCFVLAVDMAHMGRRYGDRFHARADEGIMSGVGDRDRMRIDRICAGDATGLWNLVSEQPDDLRWCGSAPLYTFLRAVPRARGELLHYQQWNIDPQSVVSFGAMTFRD